jgi:hypothetical protein
MANKDRAYGFVAKGPLLRANPHAVDASNSTAVFVGDLTSMEADGFCTPATAGDIVILGSALSYVAVSTATTSAEPLMLADSPMQLFIAQDDGVSGESTYTDDIGSAANHVAGTGSTVTLLSGHEIDISDAGVSTGCVKLLDIVRRPDNEVGANADWVCQLNVGEGLLTVAGGV